ncbi:MAG TPA: PIG-L family deacetylase [Acetobacteraceae bacterium]|jgi:LmbE family N-acetylglucosaminyl deacetylase|nr:PIG-L family deacetylase [Acetobacteraceae bacterium]
MLHIPARLRRFVSPMVQAGPVLQTWRHLPLTSTTSLLGSDPLLVLAPHPDDESLGCGGLIADCQARGQPVYVLVLTDGSRSHPRSRSHPPARLVALRAEETRAAVGELGLAPDRVAFLALRDGRAPLRGAPLRSTAHRIAEHARARGVRVICVSWPGDPHHDHVAAYRAATLAAPMIGAQVFCYPVWGWTLPPHAWVPPTPPRGGRIDITPFVAAKQRAIACHRSQATDLIQDDPDAFRMSPEFLAYFNQPYEVFIDVSSGAGR